MQASDEELVRGVYGGDHQAFAALFRRYQADVQHHLARILRDTATADDLTQEAFLRLWHRAGQWKGEGPFRPWLLRIATNLALNHLRALRRRRETPVPSAAPLDEDDEDSLVPGWMVDASAVQPDDALIDAERYARLRSIIGELSAEKQEVLRMVYDAHMETREVAAQLGIPEGTVKSRMHHARRHIARSWQQLQAQWEDD
jgi:RNA polymerase sigma-70 factor (ECF subfamily)